MKIRVAIATILLLAVCFASLPVSAAEVPGWDDPVPLEVPEKYQGEGCYSYVSGEVIAICTPEKFGYITYPKGWPLHDEVIVQMKEGFARWKSQAKTSPARAEVTTPHWVEHLSDYTGSSPPNSTRKRRISRIIWRRSRALNRYFT